MKMKLFRSICFLLILTAITTQVFAAGSVSTSLSANNSTLNSGDTVTITVSASVDSCGSGGIDLSFDSKVFQFVSGRWLLSNTFMSDFDSAKMKGVFAYDGNKKISGSAFQLVLKVKDSAPIGSTTVSATFKANSKSASNSVRITVACSHKYSNSCDTSCNNCGATRDISHSWNSGSYSKQPSCTSTGTKVYTCKVCGKTKSESVSRTSHTYDNGCDSTCNVCGNTRSVNHTYIWALEGQGHIQKCSGCGITQNSGNHTLDTTSGSDASGHGFKCTVCGLIPDAEAHTYDNDCDTSCNTCGYTRTVTHAYNEKAVYDADAHWFTCMICGAQTEKSAHEPGDKATETTDQTCKTCGFVIQKGGNHTHKASGIWHSNDVAHWTYCSCLAFFEPEAHVLTEGVIDEESKTISYECKVCKHVITEEIVEETVPEETVPPTTEPEEPQSEEKSFYGIPLWFIFACGLGVSALINLIFIICISVKKRGHFSK